MIEAQGESRRQPAYVGISGGTDDKPATLEEAIHDAALQAVADGQADVRFNVVSIEFAAHNPHITAYRVVITPGG
jgi:ABC-type phosphate/phosphonate transport system substrate-binding protein